MTTMAADGKDPEWTAMLKRIVLLLTIVTMGGGIIGSVVFGIWTVSGYLGNIDHSIQELTKSGENRDAAVKGVQNTLVTHWQVINATADTVKQVQNAVVDLKSQVSDFEKKVTGTASQPRPADGHH